MTDFFREVDEDVRRDRLVGLWTKYRFFLIALAILVVAGTGGLRLYGHYRDEAAQAASAKYEAAAQLSRDGKSAEAAAAYDALSKTAPKGYAILARLRAADERAAGDPRAAIEAYEALAADSGIYPAFRDFAKVRAAMLRVDSDDPQDFERRFAPLASDSFPYHHQIRELLGLAALKRKAFDAAGSWFDGIVSDPRAPSGAHMRAQALLGLVQSSAVLPAKPKTAGPPPGNLPAK
ncbi:MAG: tetratricopeptide repeat protein [Beijerinckiaceae bacterium]